jgi:FAD/FMN-containing dehydrogenase
MQPNALVPTFRDPGSALIARGAGPAYATATATWDQSVDHQPRAVVTPAHVDDVAAAARWAADSDLGIGLLATGHGALGSLSDSVLINLSRLSDVRLDEEERRVTVEPGARWSDVQRVTAPRGLVGLLGGSPTVGVTGYTINGGLSPLGRTFGFAADRVARFTVLDEDYEPLRVDAEHEPDLFWALRGGGGRAIVTEMEFEVLPVPDLFGGGVYYSGHDALRVLTAYRDWLPSLDDRTSTSLALLHLPPIPQLPDVLRGRFVVHLRVAHVDDADPTLDATGPAMIAPLLAAAPVIDDSTRLMTPAEIPDIHRDPVGPLAAVYRGGHLDELDDPTVEALAAAAAGTSEGSHLIIDFGLVGGAWATQPAVANAATARASAFSLYVTAAPDPDDPSAARALVDGIVERIGSSGIGAQLSFFGPAPKPGSVLALWNDEDARRLLTVSDRLDPTGRLRDGRPLR